MCSLLFYYLGGGYLTGILLVSVAANYQLGLWAERTRGSAQGRRVVAAAVAANVGLLGYFKYANFFVDQANALRMAAGLPGIPWVELALPIGVSFYSFHAMSYVIDIARGDCDAKRNPVDFGLYVTFFPQLIAGPIVRYHLIEKQLTSRQETLSNFTERAYRFCWGLAKKVLVADQVAGVVDAAFGAPTGTPWTAGTAWVAMLAYTIQIYFDFSAYSDMAIGLARMFGFQFPENFNRPYSAVSVTDFWRRWHMTLSNWFRDYLYIPLGGSHGGAAMRSTRPLPGVTGRPAWWNNCWRSLGWRPPKRSPTTGSILKPLPVESWLRSAAAPPTSTRTLRCMQNLDARCAAMRCCWACSCATWSTMPFATVRPGLVHRPANRAGAAGCCASWSVDAVARTFGGDGCACCRGSWSRKVVICITSSTRSSVDGQVVGCCRLHGHLVQVGGLLPAR